MERKVLEDLSKVSNIDKEIIDKLFQYLGYLICENVKCDRIKLIQDSILDIGIGILNISNNNGNLRIKYSPTKEMLEDLTNIEKGKDTKLKAKLEKSITEKLCDIYKDID